MAVTIAAIFLSWATIWGRRVQKNPDVKLGAAPLVGQWKFRPSIGYLMPIGLALLVIVVIPRVFARLGTIWVVLSTVVLTGAFTAALAGADGSVAMLKPVVHPTEYWYWLDKFPPVRQMLAVYDEYDFIVNFGTHIKGHPPGYVLVLKALATVGLAKPWIIASLSYMSAGIVAGSVLVVANRFGSAKHTRKAAPFLILAPYAVWMGTSADALFSALVALGAAGIAVALTSAQEHPARRIGVCVLAGLALGAGFYSSWGTVTCGPIIIAALWCGSASTTTAGHQSNHPSPLVALLKRLRTVAPVVLFVAGGIAVTGVLMTSLGYNWFAGIGLTRRLYWKGTAQFRPWKYFMVGNLGSLVFALGAVAVIGIGALGVGRIRNRSVVTDSLSDDGVGWLRAFVLAGLVCALAANFSQYSKGEVERIWLPFLPWLTLPAALLLRHRFWIVLQASTAIGLQVMLISKW